MKNAPTSGQISNQMQNQSSNQVSTASTKMSDVTAALSDIQLILNSIEHHPSQTSPRVVKAEIAIMGVLLACDAALYFADLLSGHALSQSVLDMAKAGTDLKVVAMAQIFAALAVIFAGIYAVAWRRATEAEMNLRQLIGRDLQSLRVSQIIPDLLLKFTMIGGALAVNRPDLLAPLLTAFTADYVLQGRFFRMPKSLSRIMGISLYIGSVYLVYSGSGFLDAPFAGFALAAVVSLGFLFRAESLRSQPRGEG